MVDHLAILLALRGRLLALPALAGTAATVLGSDALGYTRPAGSFITDGYKPGMEVVPAGFPVTSPVTQPGIVKAVAAGRLDIEGGRVPAADGAGRSLTVGLPTLRAWENVPFTPEDGRWYVDEDYLPGPAARRTLGKTSFESDHEPVYVIRMYSVAGKGVGAPYKMADAVLAQFPPNGEILASDGHYIRIRSDPQPTRGQLLSEGASHAVITITIPLRIRTANTI